MNYSFIILTLLGIVSDLIELTYDAGVFTRRHILPAIVYAYCWVEKKYGELTEIDMELNVYNTPLTTGLA